MTSSKYIAKPLSVYYIVSVWICSQRYTDTIIVFSKYLRGLINHRCRLGRADWCSRQGARGAVRSDVSDEGKRSAAPNVEGQKKEIKQLKNTSEAGTRVKPCRWYIRHCTNIRFLNSSAYSSGKVTNSAEIARHDTKTKELFCIAIKTKEPLFIAMKN